MTAKGKINASKIQVNDRIIVRNVDSSFRTGITASDTKTGEGVQVARVISKTAHLVFTGRRQNRIYRITTSAGTFEAAPVQTMWLAPEDAAGIKRAHVEAIAEQANRWKQGLDEIWDEAIAEDIDHEVALTMKAGAQELASHVARRSGRTDLLNADHLAHQLPTPSPATGSAVVGLLERVWDRIREDHPELPQVVIVTGSGEGAKWGHFRADSWKVREEGAATHQHELFLASEALAKGAHQVLQTMLHEAAHTMAKVRDVKDTSRQGRWHNQVFRRTAEEMGLKHQGAQADRSHGFAFVTLTQATKDRYADLLAELDREIRLTGQLPTWLGGTDGGDDDKGGERMTKPPAGQGSGEHSGSLKLTCMCEQPNIIRASRKVADKLVVRCGDCESLFVQR